MHENNSKLLFCVKCKGKLSLEILDEMIEINEGFFFCRKCQLTFPIISKIPILIENIDNFLKNRSSLGGLLYKSSSSSVMKKFMKKILTKTPKSETDFFDTEIRWTKIYLSNKNSNFYKNIQSEILKIPPKNFVIEYGSSIGIISNKISFHHKHIFGVDT